MAMPMKVVIRKVGNSLGVLLPKELATQWGVGEGDFLTAGEDGIVPPPKKNTQLVLDDLKLAISMEVVSRFTVDEIRKKSKENLARWKKQGTWGPAYTEWREVLDQGDADLVKTMIGRDDRSNRLRQSMPYVGLLPKDVVEALREKG
jgi:antitoxin component of MazEF toxin-antitoxin module